jgi:type IV secretory pathway VirB2 component (pilin)
MLIRLAGLVAVVMVIFAGVSYMTAQGNAEKAASARRRIYQSLIGLVIVFVAAGFVSFIGNKLS